MPRGGCRNSPQQACPALTSGDLRFSQEASGQLEAIITTFPCIEHSGAPPPSDMHNRLGAGSYPSSALKQTEIIGAQGPCLRPLAPAPDPPIPGPAPGKSWPTGATVSSIVPDCLPHSLPSQAAFLSISSSGSSAGPGAASAAVDTQVTREPWGSSGVNHSESHTHFFT